MQCPGFVIFADPDYPGWARGRLLANTVYTLSKERLTWTASHAPIYPAYKNSALRAIAVGAGRQRIEFARSIGPARSTREPG